MIYLDNNATTAVAPEVIQAMEPFYREFYGNPHSAHALGRKSHDAIENARGQVAELIGSESGEIVFTSCGTESNAIVLHGFPRSATRRKVVTTSVEHPSVLALLRALESKGSLELAIVGVDEHGAIRLDEMASAIDERTALVSVMHAQNETGVIHRVADVADLAHRCGALFHVDAVQAAGKIPVNVNELGADFLSISGHKLHAPKGIGALYVRHGVSVEPLWRGGGQERGLRSGTEGVPLIVGLGCGATLAKRQLPIQEDVRHLRNKFESAILSGCSEAVVNGTRQPRLPNTSSLSFRNLLASDLVAFFDIDGICASAGAACHSGKTEPSNVMKAMSRPLDEALGTVRFSLSRYTTSAEIDSATEIVLHSLNTLYQSIAPRL